MSDIQLYLTNQEYFDYNSDPELVTESVKLLLQKHDGPVPEYPEISEDNLVPIGVPEG